VLRARYKCCMTFLRFSRSVVVSSNRCDIELLNLITGATIGLPSFSTIDMYATDKSLDLIQASQDCIRTLHRIVLCQTPCDREGHIAISLSIIGK
jgi:hypothetical protein